ncbi:hypothetical protein BJY04DRAFT_183572 [Aspergillus karnatakaensis]|uniref:uncharacterized protein n=1 Tax=Aspergillus karnatakaensis TaxID=1810916 RepID=UPI003CCE42BB
MASASISLWHGDSCLDMAMYFMFLIVFIVEAVLLPRPESGFVGVQSRRLVVDTATNSNAKTAYPSSGPS